MALDCAGTPFAARSPERAARTVDARYDRIVASRDSTVDSWRPAGLIGQFAWEAILLVATIAVAVTAALDVSGILTRSLVIDQIAALGLMATGFALSLRTGTPNLAVAAIAGFSGALGFELANHDWSYPLAVLLIVAGALVVGAIVGVFAGLTSVPAWALTLGLAAAVSAVGLAIVGPLPIALRERPLSDLIVNLCLVGFLVISLGGGALWLIPAVRQALSGPGVVAAVVGLAGSSALAALGGALYARFVGAALLLGGPDIVFAVGAALLGGVSVFGRRGGVAGTALAVSLMTILATWLAASAAPRWQINLLSAVAIVVGLVVSVVLRQLGRPRSEDVAD